MGTPHSIITLEKSLDIAAGSKGKKSENPSLLGETEKDRRRTASSKKIKNRIAGGKGQNTEKGKWAPPADSLKKTTGSP